MGVQLSYVPSFMDWEKKNNVVADATVNYDATTHHAVTVPTDKRWIILSIRDFRDANGTLDITLRNAATNVIHTIADEAAGTGAKWYDSNLNWVLDEGEYVYFEYGAAQGAGAFLSVVVLESTKLI